MYLKKYNLKNKVALVTGAGKGLGKACAIALAEAGANLVIISRTQKDLNQVSKIIKKFKVKCKSYLCDVTDYDQIKSIITCGGGRKNKFLMNKIQEFLGSSIRLKLIDDFNIDGDFVESKAFAFLAIRSYEKMPISFPKTTGCLKSCTGGEVIEN